MEQAQEQARPGNTKQDAQGKFRSWILTLWSESAIIDFESNNVIYSVVGKEICPDTGKLHFHQFIYFKTPRTFGGVKKLTHCDSHIERCFGKNSEAIAYCTKDGEIICEKGIKPNDNGIKNIKQIIDESKNISEIMENEPETYCKYRQGLNELMLNKQRKNRKCEPIKFTWIYGSTGKGKTKYAFEKGAVPVEYNNGFFSDWKDAKIICIEELRGEIPYRILLKLSDIYHNYYEINIKGGQKLIDIDELIITSPYPPEEVYKGQVTKEDSINQLLRRITKLICVDNTDEAFV